MNFVKILFQVKILYFENKEIKKIKNSIEKIFRLLLTNPDLFWISIWDKKNFSDFLRGFSQRKNINMKNFLNKSGIIFITVPNANSIHRLIGVEMSLLENKYQLNTSDIKGGHQRVYDFKSLTDDIKKAGLTIKDSGGYNLKMISLTQMKDCPQELLDAIFTISQSMPIEICTNLWVTCKNNGENI